MPAGVIVLLLFAAAYVLVLLSPGREERALRASLEQGSPGPLLEEILAKPVDLQGAYFSRAMQRIWQRGDEGLSVQLVQSFLQARPKSSKGLAWLGRVLGEKPGLACRFDPVFLEENHDPDGVPGGTGG